MKKIILIFVLALTMGCEKISIQKQQCYDCLITYWNGTRVNKEYCGKMPAEFKDNAGNDLPYTCQPK